MKSNVVAAIKAPFYVNPLTRLWRTLEDSHILKVFEIFKWAKIAMMQILGLVEDEQTFSILSFMK
jgi:hypothetical protein